MIDRVLVRRLAVAFICVVTATQSISRLLYSLTASLGASFDYPVGEVLFLLAALTVSTCLIVAGARSWVRLAAILLFFGFVIHSHLYDLSDTVGVVVGCLAALFFGWFLADAGQRYRLWPFVLGIVFSSLMWMSLAVGAGEIVVRYLELGAFVRPRWDGLLFLGTTTVAMAALLSVESGVSHALRLMRLRSDEVLKDIIPRGVLPQVMRGDGSISRRHDSVTIMFADLVNFTDLSKRWESRDPNAVMDVLEALFKNFDAACSHFGCEKIKTMGDGYLAVKGLYKETATNSAISVLRLARELNRIVVAVNKNFNVAIGLRIGINTGPVIAGVIGRSKAAFDIWGKAVNVASRLEGQAETDSMMISEITYALIPESDRVEAEQKRLTVKGVGEITAYQIPL